jgi:hypothetical protein
MESKQAIEFKLSQLGNRTVDIPQTFNGTVTMTAGLLASSVTATTIDVTELNANGINIDFGVIS